MIKISVGFDNHISCFSLLNEAAEELQSIGLDDVDTMVEHILACGRREVADVNDLGIFLDTTGTHGDGSIESFFDDLAEELVA